jgi:signal transduction histidine kinase
MKLQAKLALFSATSKILFVAVFLLSMPFVLERINLINTDNDLIEKREKFISMLEDVGVDGIREEQQRSFGSYNILKEEYISFETTGVDEYWNFIEVTERMIEGEVIAYRVLNYTFYVDDQMYLLEIGKSLSSIRQTERNIQWLALLMLLFFVAVTMILDLGYVKFLLDPFQRIVDKKLKQSVDPERFNFELTETSTEDFRLLDLTINEMMYRIQSVFRKEREITSNVSHELLTPVSVLQGKLENLLNDPETKGENLKKISEALKTVGRLKSIVNSLLLIARIENEEYLKQEKVDLLEVTREVAEELLEQFESAGIVLELSLFHEQTIQRGNKSLIFTMLLNIIGNALKHTPKGQKVIISTRRDQNKLILSIHNSGVFIREQEIREIFERFKSFTSEKKEGHGLGLAIAKSIADFHGIGLLAKSSIEEGTAFELLFSY